MIYIKDEVGRLLTLKDLANKYNTPLSLIKARYNKGIREIEKLTQAKYEMLQK